MSNTVSPVREPETGDLIDRLAGIAPGSPLDAVRAQRPEARANAQSSYEALFGGHGGAGAEAMGAVERFAVAAFVAGLNQEPAAAEYYAGQLRERESAVAEAVADELAAARTSGPYGNYPPGPLSHESRDGLRYAVGSAAAEVLGSRLGAAVEHAHLLVFRPREATPGALQRLLDAGWSTDGIVTLSQLISFLNFQVRVVAGLRLLRPADQITERH